LLVVLGGNPKFLLKKKAKPLISLGGQIIERGEEEKTKRPCSCISLVEDDGARVGYKFSFF
jgi:hypothetical protein